MKSWWQNVQTRNDQTQLKQGLSRVQAAQNAPYGSLAQQWDPNRYGSIESRQNPGVFGSQGLANPQYQAQMKLRQQQQAEYQRQQMRVQGLRQAIGGRQLSPDFMAGLMNSDEGDDNGYQ